MSMTSARPLRVIVKWSCSRNSLGELGGKPAVGHDPSDALVLWHRGGDDLLGTAWQQVKLAVPGLHLGGAVLRGLGFPGMPPQALIERHVEVVAAGPALVVSDEGPTTARSLRPCRRRISAAVEDLPDAEFPRKMISRVSPEPVTVTLAKLALSRLGPTIRQRRDHMWSKRRPVFPRRVALPRPTSPRLVSGKPPGRQAPPRE
jgi:hypothetical protein